MPTQTAVKDKLSTAEVSALYDRIYDIADRLFKKYNPCNIQAKNNKTKCINNHYNHIHLCCQYWNDRCEHWKNGCTVKCLACKLFICGALLYEYDKYGIQKINKKYKLFINKVKRLRKIANRYGLSNFDYYMTKKRALQMRSKL